MNRVLEIRQRTKVNCFFVVFCYLCCLVTSQTVYSLSFGTVNQALSYLLSQTPLLGSQLQVRTNIYLGNI